MGIPDITLIPGPKVALWGDSFVEAVQVDDKKKTAQRLTQLFKKHAINTTAFAVGAGGLSVADYFFSIPRFEHEIPHIQAHVIILGSIQDVIPDLETQCHSTLLSQPPRLKENECIPSPTAIQFTPWLYRLSMPFIFDIYRKLSQARSNLRPSTARFAQGSSALPVYLVDLTTIDTWRFLIKRLKQVASAPIIFLYSPDVPSLENGHIILTDRNSGAATAFARVCAEENVPFINTTNELTTYFKKTHAMTRGVFNMPPGDGHFNDTGHALVAQALFRYFSEANHAVH
jgi:hypothetical protein